MRLLNLDDLDWDVDQGGHYRRGPFTSRAMEYDSDGNVVAVIDLVDGVKDGEECHYMPNGRLVYAGVWKRGHGVGVHEAWYADGQIKERARYENGRLAHVDRCAPDGSPK
jgi:antitoxin component YwqK of YwqJK toxin-antitoxin module